MRRLFGAAGVDYDQWRVLTRAMLRLDLRVTGARTAGFGTGTSAPEGTAFVGQAIMYLLLGVVAAIMVFVIDDLMLAATLVLTYVMFMVGIMILVDHQSVVTSPDDYGVLGWRPISSRTYFAVRLANVFVYTLALTTLYGALPMLAVGVAHGFQPLLWLAAIPAFYGATIFVAMALVFSYARMLRVVGANRLARVLSYLQVIIGVLLYAGYFLPGEILRYRQMALTMPDTPWALLYPPTWFAGYLAIASGSAGPRELAGAAVSAIAIAALARGLGGRLSLEYASRLGAIASATAAAPSLKRRNRRPWLFRRGEHRAMSLLVRAQFRHDQKFRMAVLGILPMTIIYMYMSFRDGLSGDPFGGTMDGIVEWIPLSVAVLFFPMMLRQSLQTTDAYRASWIYFGTPCSRGRILRAQTDVLTAAFVAPYLIVVAAAMAYFNGHPAGVATHVLFLGLGSRLLVQAMTAASPVLPFSQPPQKLGRSGGVMFWMLVAAFGGIVFSPLLVLYVYVSPVRIGLALAGFMGASVLLDRLTRAQMGEEAALLEFAA